MKSDMEYETLEPSGEFAASISDFRSAVTHVAQCETAQPVSADWLAPARRRHRKAQLKVGLGIAVGWACAALLCLATLPLFTHPHHGAIAPVSQAAAASPARSGAAPPDQALLDQVDTNIAASVPTSLEPLAELETWNSTSTNASTSGDSTNGTSLNQTEKPNVAH